MNKRLLTFLFIFILIGENYIITYGYDSNNIEDELNYLTRDEIQDLQEYIYELQFDYGITTQIIITKDLGEQTSKEFADDYYNKYYSTGEEKRAVLIMIINMKHRRVSIITKGTATKLFEDNIDSMTKNVAKKLSNEQYYEAVLTFINDIRNESPLYYHRIIRKILSQIVSLRNIVFALFISIALTKNLVEVTTRLVIASSRTYEESCIFKLNHKTDKCKEA